MKQALIILFALLTVSVSGQKVINLNKATDVEVIVNTDDYGNVTSEIYVYYFDDGSIVSHMTPTNDIEVLKLSQQVEYDGIKAKEKEIERQKEQLLAAIEKLDIEHSMLSKKKTKLIRAWVGDNPPIDEP